jgi:hypothetical protein
MKNPLKSVVVGDDSSPMVPFHGGSNGGLDNLPFNEVNEARAIRHRLRVRLGAMSKL